MPAPSSSLATQRPDLAVSFEQFNVLANIAGAAGPSMLPMVTVPRQAGNYGVIPAKELMVESNVDRAPGGAYKRDDWEFEPRTYNTRERGKESPVDDRESQMYMDYFDAERVAGNRSLSDLMINAEKRYRILLYNETTFSSNAVAVNWATVATSTPRTDIKNAKQTVYNQCGVWPNTLLINEFQRQDLIDSAQLIDRLKFWGGNDPNPANVSNQVLAAALDIEQIVVAGMTRNSANRGQAPIFAQIWPNSHAMVAVTARTNDFREVCIGRTFHWGEDGSTFGGTMETYRDETVRSNIVRARHDVTEDIIYAAAGTLLKDVKV